MTLCRFYIESTLKSIINGAKEIKISFLSVHIGKIKAREEMEISENFYLENFRLQIECDEQDAENSNFKILNASKTLNRQICELKVIIYCSTQFLNEYFFCCVIIVYSIYIFPIYLPPFRTSLTEEQNVLLEASNIVKSMKKYL